MAKNDALIRFYFKKNPRKMSNEVWCRSVEEIDFVLKYTGQLVENG